VEIFLIFQTVVSERPFHLAVDISKLKLMYTHTPHNS
jgi:hypothetical protein